MNATDPFLGPWRLLVVKGSSKTTSERLIASTDLDLELHGLPHVQVQTLETPKLADIHAALASFRPNLLYLWAGSNTFSDLPTCTLSPLVLASSDGTATQQLPASELLGLASVVPLHALILNIHPEGLPLSDLRQHVPHVVHWTPGHPAPAVNAAMFAFSSLSCLRHEKVTFPEAFALGVHLLRAHTSHERSPSSAPLYPVFLSNDLPTLPGTQPLPAPQVEGLDMSAGLGRAVPGWDNTRLLSPVAEVSLAVMSLPSLLDAERLAALGLALRALLSLEIRSLRVVSAHALAHTPSHIVPGSDVARFVLITRAGVPFPVVLGAPTQVMKTPALLHTALQTTLTCDALSLRFQLPPYGSTAPESKSSPGIARGVPTTPVLLVTSLWVVTLLRTVAASVTDRLAPLLGLGAVSSQAALGLSYTRLNGMGAPPTAAFDANLEVTATAVNTATLQKDKAEKARLGAKLDRSSNSLRETKFDEITRNAETVDQWVTDRPPLHLCTPAEFTADLMRFLSERHYWQLEPARFPDAVLNGSSLDLWNLYREVVTRGGFKVGNGINWKGQVFTKMSNWTATHKMTGVGNALKRHYHNFLWEYERANQRDVAGDRCAVCHQGVDGGSDWLACGSCQRWQHHACDQRATIGSFADFKNDAGRVFECLDCERARQKTTPQLLHNLGPAAASAAPAYAPAATS